MRSRQCVGRRGLGVSIVGRVVCYKGYGAAVNGDSWSLSLVSEAFMDPSSKPVAELVLEILILGCTANSSSHLPYCLKLV